MRPLKPPTTLLALGLTLAVLTLLPPATLAERTSRLAIELPETEARQRLGPRASASGDDRALSSALVATCGDSLLDAGEECDDGNVETGDGCSEVCLIEDGWTCSEPEPPSAGTNIISDPGFEAGTPNPFWTEASTNFGTPLCTVADCGEEGSGPASGLWWAWFGGTTAFEEGSLSQELIIPATATTLEFQLEQIFCDSVDDFLQVRIDGSPVFTTDGASPRCGELGYAPETVDVSAFADDGTHTLELFSQTFGTGGDITDFFVDDLVLLDNVAVEAQPSECFLLVPLECNGPVFDFDTPVPGIPRDWPVVDNEATGMIWTDIEGSGEDGNYTGGAGDAATASSDAFGVAEYDTELRTVPFDLPALGAGSAAILGYKANYQDLFGGAESDRLDLDISTDGGTGWTTLLSWDENHDGIDETSVCVANGDPLLCCTGPGAGDCGFRSPPGEEAAVDLSAYLGMNGLILRWRYYNPALDDFDWYAQIDDVALTCGSPEISVSPSALATTLQAGTQALQALSIANIGLGSLEWSLLEAPSACAAPADVPWLSASPIAGTTPGGDMALIDMTLGATGLAPAVYEARICVASNDAGSPTVEVPVTMTVAGCVDDLTLSDTTLTGGEFRAALTITGGPALVVDGPVDFIAGEAIVLVDDVELHDGFSAGTAANPCP